MQILLRHKQQQNVEYSKYFGSMIANGTRCTENKSGIATAKVEFNKKEAVFSSQLD
jgi:hypothetical protein